MKNQTFCLVLVLVALVSNDAIAQKTKSLGARRAAKLEATLDKNVGELRETYDEKIAGLESEFTKEAEELTNETCETLEAIQKAVAADDLNLAVSIRDQIADIRDRNASPRAPSKKKVGNDPVAGTTWDFLGSDRKRINGFKFNRDGTILAENTYVNASWTRINERTLLFNYSPGGSFIVFHEQSGGGLMKGYHSGAGKVRYIRSTK